MPIVPPDPERLEGDIEPHVRDQRYELQLVAARPVRRGACYLPQTLARSDAQSLDLGGMVHGRARARALPAHRGGV